MKNGKVKFSYESLKLASVKSASTDTNNSASDACHAGGLPSLAVSAASVACHAGGLPG